MIWDILNEEAQSTTEYSLIIAFVSLIIIVSLSTFGTTLFGLFQSFVNLIP